MTISFIFHGEKDQNWLIIKKNEFLLMRIRMKFQLFKVNLQAGNHATLICFNFFHKL